ncbi:hypothetical protein KIPB_002922 [Kipferlia bialata]|uniref:Uncharacterized protein n=1 Tax=Kipferlia bialata TaxID=797122 RepID=A0A9K3GFD8_9EUKA|nr:hypothetical protein KIPB_002922 [Kipferlia bialata]|eukprot:g2922.t1
MAHAALDTYPEAPIAEAMCEMVMQFAGAGLSTVKALISDGCTEWVVGALKQYGTDPEQSDLVLVGLGALALLCEDTNVKSMVDSGVLGLLDAVTAAHTDSEAIQAEASKIRQVIEGK